ncbi:hypothetical protein M2318_002536 [Metapseudomonas resinovorans]
MWNLLVALSLSLCRFVYSRSAFYGIATPADPTLCVVPVVLAQSRQRPLR